MDFNDNDATAFIFGNEGIDIISINSSSNDDDDNCIRWRVITTTKGCM